MKKTGQTENETDPLRRLEKRHAYLEEFLAERRELGIDPTSLEGEIATLEADIRAMKAISQRQDHLRLLIALRRERQKLGIDTENLDNEIRFIDLGTRLSVAHRRGEEVEIFITETREKHVGTIARLEGTGLESRLMLKRGPSLTPFRFDQILTIRDRKEDLTSRFVNVPSPQYRDKSINESLGGRKVLVDFADLRLTQFLEEYADPIRRRLEKGRINQRDAAKEAWRAVHDYVPYDFARFEDRKQLPHHLYRLGDFIEQGVCNERGMLLQVVMQSIGIGSRMEKGYVAFLGGRHAWVRTVIEGKEIILDPQVAVMEVGGEKDMLASQYMDDATRFAQSKVGTVLGGFGIAQEAFDRLQAEGVDPLSPEVQIRLRGLGPGKLLTWKDIETFRLMQVAFQLQYLNHEYFQVGSSLSPDPRYSRLSKGEREREQRTALAVYDKLSSEERKRLWQKTRGEPDGTFPSSFLNLYQEVRIRIHESRQFPFGKTEGLEEAILREFRNKSY